MNAGRTMTIAAAAAVLWLWIMSIANTMALRAEFMPQEPASGAAPNISCDSMPQVVALAERALARQLAPADDTADASVYSRDPFVNVDTHAGGKKPAAGTRVNARRPAIVLKGVLAKKNPLAIFEDERGKTYICAVGDTIAGAVVRAIDEEKTTLRDGAGTFVISMTGNQ